MKKFRLILAVCLAFIGIWVAHAEDVGDVARAAVRRAGAGNIATTNRQPSTSTNSASTPRTNTGARARTTNSTVKSRPGVSERTSKPAPNNTNTVVSRNTTNNVAPRTTTNTSRSATRTATPANSLTTQSRTVARVGSGNTVTREDILSRDYSKCKKVFFDCMDEFCANKDSQLKRCACSSRVNEFNSVKKQLSAVEEKMLDFNQRLLTVSMEKEDAAALNVATEGEEAYLGTKDTSASKKTLDEIAKKLKTSFNTSNFNSDMNLLSWSLDIDSAFDSVDSLMGASTTSKSGTALYSAALPVCREMAAEVCNDIDIPLAEGGYQALIEQDCNTVAQTYKSQTEQARAKVLEGSALLDMSRLDIYQKRNSDDILTCKRKMLDMLTDSTICGKELGKCLDITGQYIDPTTGEAFLSTKLINLTSLITRPSDTQTWSSVPSNSAFVLFLNSKKKFLEPAMEQCQTIADTVWDSFIDDALAQIKLAQDKKLDEVRQSCTTLTGQCLANATASIINFDARALSTFGIDADNTANAMCSDIINSCAILLDTANPNNTWETGISEITTDTTYDTLMQTCRQVGRACIIQICSSSSGNFGLCESLSQSTNRKAVISGDACWNEVKNCIAKAGEENIDKIIQKLGLGTETSTDLNFYGEMYSNADSADKNNDNPHCIVSNDGADLSNPSDANKVDCIYDRCRDDCFGTESTLFNCRTCRLAEKIWGNCEANPLTQLTDKTNHNRIKQPLDNVETLLYWFAVNTGTNTAQDSCRDTTCGIGLIPIYDAANVAVKCVNPDSICYASYDSQADALCNSCIYPFESIENAKCMNCGAEYGASDSLGNCCKYTAQYATPATSEQGSKTLKFCKFTQRGKFTIITQPYKKDNSNKKYILVCNAGTMQIDKTTPTCKDGNLVEIEYEEDTSIQGVSSIHYWSPSMTITESVMSQNGTCTYNYGNGTDGTWTGDGATYCSDHKPEHWIVFATQN